MPTIADYLVSHGCTRTGALVLGSGNQLVKSTYAWSPSISLLTGPDFHATFLLRYGVRYTDRRSPLESETLSEAFNRLDQALAAEGICGLPRGYSLTEQDKTDLFYVLGPRGGLAIRELVMPEVDRVLGTGAVPPTPEEPVPVLPPVMPPTPPSPDPPPVLPELPSIQPTSPPVLPVSPAPPLPTLTLTPSALTTLAAIKKWQPPWDKGRVRNVRKLAQEIQDHLDRLERTDTTMDTTTPASATATPTPIPASPALAAATKKKAATLKLSFQDYAEILFLIPMLQVLFPEIQKEIKGLGKTSEELAALLPATLQAVEILKRINTLATT